VSFSKHDCSDQVSCRMCDACDMCLTQGPCCVAGNNGLFGTVPSSWASMGPLQDLELDYNCGLCGSLPTFPMQVGCCMIGCLTPDSIQFDITLLQGFPQRLRLPCVSKVKLHVV